MLSDTSFPIPALGNCTLVDSLIRAVGSSINSSIESPSEGAMICGARGGVGEEAASRLVMRSSTAKSDVVRRMERVGVSPLVFSRALTKRGA